MSHRGASSSSRQQSSTPGKRSAADRGDVNATHKACQTVLTELATKIEKNQENIPKEQVELWKTTILDQFTTLTQNKLMDEWLENNIDDSIQKSKTGMGAINFNDLLNQVMNDINQKREASKAHFEVQNHEAVKKVKRALYPDQAEEDEDLVLMESNDNDNRFRCPILMTMMDAPMGCKTACKHHVSRQAWEGSLLRSAKQGVIKCPIPGCVAQWHTNRVELDEEFNDELKKFLRKKNILSNLLEGGESSSSTQDAIELE